MSTLFNFGIAKQDLKRIIDADARRVSTHCDKYYLNNKDKYNVLCNTWLLVCYDVAGPRAARVLRNAIIRDGLITTIDTCANLASDIIKSDFSLTPNSVFSALFVEDPRLTLQVLRYPKRFSPSDADLLDESALKAFLDTNKRSKGVASVISSDGRVLKRTIHYPRFLIKEVKNILHDMLFRGTVFIAFDSGNNPAFHDNVINANGNFSNGATADGCHTMFEKYLQYSSHASYYLDPLYPISGGFGEEIKPDLDFVKTVCVPKSYKAPRIIAEVSAFTQYHMQGIRKIAEYSYKNSKWAELIHFDDQSFNQDLAFLGSAYGTYATIDLSSASDSIADHLAEQILPKLWYKIVSSWNPEYILVNGKKYRRYIFLTSGSGDTFTFESLIFLAIAIAAWRYSQLFLEEELFLPFIFGDDIACDVRMVDTLYDFLEMLGFIVNRDKSFTSGSRYRESCGAEFFCGLDTSTKYFPRKAFDESDPTYLEGLVALQHRLFEFPNAEAWLSTHIRNLAPKFGVKTVTGSMPGTDCDDLWEDYPYYKVVNPPFDHTKMAQAPDGIRREGHMSLKPKRQKPFSDWWASKPKRPIGPNKLKPITPHDIALCEMFRYVDFLRSGMQYDEYGIPIHRQPIPDDFIKPILGYTTSIR